MCSTTAPDLVLVFEREGGPNGRIVAFGTLQRLVKHGLWHHIDVAGGWSEVTWADGVREGPCREYRPSGRLAVEGQHVAGLRGGEWRTYAADGRLLDIATWLRGRVVKVDRRAYW